MCRGVISMAWYYGVFACGHEGRVGVIGPLKNRPWKIEQALGKKCPDCYEKERKEKMEQACIEAKIKSEEYELPVLSGSDKQIRWANIIRIELLDYIQSLITEDGSDRILKKAVNRLGIEKNELSDLYQYIASNKLSAVWYIDRRDSIDDVLISKLFTEYEQSLVQEKEKDIKELVDAEAILKPVEQKYSGIVDIKVIDGYIKAYYEKNDDFIRIVKKFHYTWEGVWRLKVTFRQENVADRVAELGNELLRNGFVIKIIESEARRKAVSGDFEPACYKWVTKANNNFKITWHGKDDTLYRRARKLSSSEWNNGGVTVKVAYYNEVQEFADKEGFKLSPGAKELLETYKSEFEKVTPVEVAAPISSELKR